MALTVSPPHNLDAIALLFYPIAHSLFHRSAKNLLAKGLLEPDVIVSVKPWGAKEFVVFDPDRVLLTFFEQKRQEQHLMRKDLPL